MKSQLSWQANIANGKKPWEGKSASEYAKILNHQSAQDKGEPRVWKGKIKGRGPRPPADWKSKDVPSQYMRHMGSAQKNQIRESEMSKIEVIKRLVSLANGLDKLKLKKQADELDELIDAIRKDHRFKSMQDAGEDPGHYDKMVGNYKDDLMHQVNLTVDTAYGLVEKKVIDSEEELKSFLAFKEKQIKSGLDTDGQSAAEIVGLKNQMESRIKHEKGGLDPANW